MVQVARVVTESRWGGGDGLRWCCKECVRVAGRKAHVREGTQTVGAKAADGDQSAQSAASAQRASQPGGRGRYVCRYGLKSTSYRHLWRRRSDGANLHCKRQAPWRNYRYEAKTTSRVGAPATVRLLTSPHQLP